MLEDRSGAPEATGAPSPDEPERVVRLHVHLALASALLGFLAPIVGWGLWIADRRAPPGPWRRRLLALALADSVLVLALGAASALGFDVDPAARDPQRIGVALDARTPDGPPVVERVAPGSPAEGASVQPGDRIVAVDDRPVSSRADLVRAIAETREGHVRRLAIERGDETVDVTVVPRVDVRAPLPSRSLFEPIVTERADAPRSGRGLLGGAGALSLWMVAALTVAARRRRSSAGPGLAVVGCLVALALVSTLVLIAFESTTGVSLGAILVALLAGSVALLVTGTVAIATLGGTRSAPSVRTISTSTAIGLGLLYGIGGAARLAAAAAVLVAAFDLPLRTAAEAFAVTPSWGPGGVALFVAATVIVAPISEEVVFRGVLLPWLSRWMRPAAALGWSALVFAVGHLYYGLGALLIAHYGLVFGWARLRTGKLWAPVALHALLNGTTVVALLLGAR